MSSEFATASQIATETNSYYGTFIVVYIIALIFAYVVVSFLISRIFKKAGAKTSIAWIPIYNTWKIYELGDQQGYWALLAFIPGVNIASAIFLYIAMYNIGKKFGKPDWFIVLAILAAPIWYVILAFDKSVWNGTADSNPVINPAINPAIQPSFVSIDQTTPVVEVTPQTDFNSTITPVTDGPVEPYSAPMAETTIETAEPVVQTPEAFASIINTPAEPSFEAPVAPVEQPPVIETTQFEAPQAEVTESSFTAPEVSYTPVVEPETVESTIEPDNSQM